MRAPLVLVAVLAAATHALRDGPYIQVALRWAVAPSRADAAAQALVAICQNHGYLDGNVDVTANTCQVGTGCQATLVVTWGDVYDGGQALKGYIEADLPGTGTYDVLVGVTLRCWPAYGPGGTCSTGSTPSPTAFSSSGRSAGSSGSGAATWIIVVVVLFIIAGIWIRQRRQRAAWTRNQVLVRQQQEQQHQHQQRHQQPLSPVVQNVAIPVVVSSVPYAVASPTGDGAPPAYSEFDPYPVPARTTP